jgi:phage tail sheath protein FI
MNNQSPAASVISGSLPSGSNANVRWEVVASNSGSGTFSLIIRRGDDNELNKTILETWTGLSLDPNEPNYIAFVLGDQTRNAQLDENGSYYVQTSGSYPNKSSYVRVKSMAKTTPNYFNNNGIARNEFTASLPKIGSGSTHGSFGTAQGALFGGQLADFTTNGPMNLFESIPNTTSDTVGENIQGVQSADYNVAINMMGNKDAYRYNVVYAPGLTSQNSPSQISNLLSLVSDRGDAIAVVDMVGYAQSKTQAITQAANYDNSYAATYWPWVQVRSRETGKLNFIPASTLIPAVYEYNDKVSAEWFAPAGLNRGGLATVIQPERRVSVDDRNFLYQGKVNPIAVFPGVGTVVYGQKTLQSKASALDRVNVRRLLIALKSYIGQVGESLVFEPNTQVTRNKFLNQVNPYLEYVQQRQGLYAFQVTMDESNNTPDVIDRNQLVGTIYLQPTRAAEFIYLNFNVLPTGTSFS